MAEETPQKFKYTLDSPVKEQLEDRRVTIRGWLVPEGKRSVKAMRVRNDEQTFSVRYGIERRDVADALPEFDREKSLHSGFMTDIEFSKGELVLEVDLGEGYEEVKTLHLEYIGGKPIAVNYNPHLASNWAEHVDILANRKAYFYEAESAGHFIRKPKDPKLVAFYLPQFYPIPENDLTWGKGFTEWRNVTTAQPRFIGHQQPMLPSDLGFYDLRLDDVIKQQIDLAKQYGIYGFCLYYYWFSGKKMLDIPLSAIRRHQDWDFNFMICWANENWTKRWDGMDNDVIVAQQYLDGDPLAFIKDVEDILLDPRYIQVDGKPVLVVYRVADLKDPKLYVKVWRDYFRKQHNQELHLVSVLSFDNQDPKKDGFDAAIEFMPQGIGFRASDFPNKAVPTIDVNSILIDRNFDGTVFDYRAIVREPRFHEPLAFRPYQCLMPSWDKDARKKGRDSATYYYSNPDVYGQWLDKALATHVAQKQDLLFINAWNEWAEGTVLEPSLHYGHAILKRTAEVLSRYSTHAGNAEHFPLYGLRRSPATKLAVVVHVYYPEQWPFIEQKLAALDGQQWDLYITLNDKEVAFAEKIKSKFPQATIFIAPNRGRDILPFVHVARRLDRLGYTQILKLHTKKSLRRHDGLKWFEDLVGTLLPGKVMVGKVLKALDKGAGIIGPKGHFVSLETYIGSNRIQMEALLAKLPGMSAELDTKAHGYFAGSMFWANMAALRPILDLYLMPEDFAAEKGEVDGTLAHVIERLIGVVADRSEYDSYALSKWRLEKVAASKASSNFKYNT